MNFPGGPVVKNLSCNAGNLGRIPAGGTKIPHAVEQRSLCTATTEPECFGVPVPQPESSRVLAPQPEFCELQCKITRDATKIPSAATKT